MSEERRKVLARLLGFGAVVSLPASFLFIAIRPFTSAEWVDAASILSLMTFCFCLMIYHLLFMRKDAPND